MIFKIIRHIFFSKKITLLKYVGRTTSADRQQKTALSFIYVKITPSRRNVLASVP